MKKIYFASDFHLGAPDEQSSKQREREVVKWLEFIRHDAGELFLVGDVFDFWFEYKTVVPRGYVRLLGKIAEIADAGIPVHWFTGNHDMWIFDYLPNELGVTLHRQPVIREWNGKRFFIGHGDGLGPGDKGYKFIKKVFRSKVSQWLFARLHPNLGIGVASYFSNTSRNAGQDDRVYLGEENEWLVLFAREMLKKNHYDYFIFGHRHLPLKIDIGENAVYYNLGEWMNYQTFLEFDGTAARLMQFTPAGAQNFSTKSIKREE